MIDANLFIKVCNTAKLLQLLNGVNFPTFVTHDKHEGIELKGGKLITFWVKDNLRIYEQPIESKSILAVISTFTENKPDVPEEKAKGKAHDNLKEPEKSLQSSELYGIMPESISNTLFNKWASMPISERLIMCQKTDVRYIQERSGRGGKQKYVEGHYMVLCANMAFGFKWSSHVQQWEKTGTEIICMGYVEAKIEGELIRKYAVGQKDIIFPKGDSTTPICLGDDYKAAEMDMIKKALSFFGIAKDVYAGEV